jgi:hypothetical protein
MGKILFFLLISTQLFAQSLKEKLVGEWVKDDIRLKDGSPILLEDVKNMQLRYNFSKDYSFQITINGKTGKGTYKIKGDTILVGKSTLLEVLEIDETKLVVQELYTDPATPPSKAKIKFIPARFHNLGYFPEKYRTKGQDTIYISKHDYLEPFFLDPDRSAAQFISDNFIFPYYKAGDFYARFIITKLGEIKGIEILNSTHEKYNENLIKAIKASKGKWLPAMWEGKPVNAEIKMGFDMGWSEKLSVRSQTSTAAPKDTIEKRYSVAIKNLTLSLNADPRNIDAYYARAAVYALTKDTQKMCVDLLQLKHMEQVKGTELWKKFCDKK